MVQITSPASTRRPRGRPQLRSDDETRALIIEAAREEFGAKGFAATCMADVAQRAGVSTKTLYRLIPTKADLFSSVISERIGRFALEADPAALDKLDAAAAVERILIAFGTLTLEAGTIAMTRLVIGEARAFPEIGASFFEIAIRRTSQAMEAALRRLCARGLIALDDPGGGDQHAARHDDHGAATRGHARPARAARRRRNRRARKTLREAVPGRMRGPGAAISREISPSSIAAKRLKGR